MTKLTLKTIPERLLQLKAALEDGKGRDASKAEVSSVKIENENNKEATKLQKQFDPVPKKEKQTRRVKSVPIPLSQNGRVQDALAWLVMTFPKAFSQDHHIPLKVGIVQDIFDVLEQQVALETTEKLINVQLPSRRAIRQALSFYVTSPYYVQSLVEKNMRVDLNGHDVEVVSEEHKAYALKTVERMKKRRQKRQQKQKNALEVQG